MVNFKDQVELSKKLVVIEKNIPEDFDPERFKYKEPDLEKVMNIMDELEFRNLKERIAAIFGGNVQQQTKSGEPVQGDLFAQPGVSGQTAATAYSSFKTIDSVSHSYHLIDNEISRASLRADLSVQKEFCFDTETSSLNAMDAELVGMSFSWKENEAYYVPVPQDRKEALKIVSEFKEVFGDGSIVKMGQNIKYDILVLRNYDMEVKGELFDTMVAHHLLHPGLKNSMDFMAETYLNYSPVSIESLIGKKGKGQGSMRNVDIDTVKEYAAEDADVTLRLAKLFKAELEKSEVKKLFYNVEMPLVRVLADMEYEGVTLDVKALNSYAEVLRKDIAELENKIYEMAGRSFNIASPRQVGEILFDVLKIDDKAKKTKSGQYSTGEDILQKLKSKHEIIPAILEYRGLKKLLNTYVESLPKLINPKTGRIHTSYNQTVVVTGRLSSTNPNLQNIPIRDEAGREIRKAFTASDHNHVFLSADYSQVELRLMAHFSGDKHLIEAFRNGEDIHRATAAKIFKVSLEEVDQDMRRKAKTANFGIIYGISAFGLADRLNIPRSEAKAIIDGYFENFPGVKEFMDKSIKEAREKGYVETLFGRRRYLPDINSRNGVVRGIAERNAINAPIQGTAADIIKMSMVSIFKRFEEENISSKMILQVHDELNFNVHEKELEQVKDIVKKEMESACELSVPLVVDMGTGSNWLEAH
jgi:DNA polymerase-1